MDVLSITPDMWIQNPDQCLQMLMTDIDKVPVLRPDTESSLSPGQLARFTGMVQDIPNPVYYLHKYEVRGPAGAQIRCGMYKENLELGEGEQVQFDSDDCERQERRLYHCVSIPGLNPWAKPALRSNLELSEQTSPSHGVKRDVEDMDVDDKPSGVKRLCTSKDNQVEVSSKPSKITQNTMHPIPSHDNHSCLLNCYSGNEGETELKVGDVVDVIGFYWKSDEDLEDEDNTFPGVGSLHVVKFSPVIHSNPLVAADLTGSVLDPVKVRSDLHLAMTQLLLGDTLAADYLICHLISNIYLRDDCLVLGKLSLNLSHIPIGDYPSQMYSVLSTLVPKSHYFPMSIQMMNSISMCPEKCYETNRLRPGRLQLSDRTHLVLDETALEPGKLLDTGVRNVQALNSVIKFQKLNYNFKYYNLDFNTNIPILVLSEGKSLLPSDIHVKLAAEQTYSNALPETFQAVKQFLSGNTLDDIRRYLTIASHGSFTLDDSLNTIIQEHFVDMRRRDSKATQDDLHNLLVLARLLALSHGHTVLNKSMWDQAVEMEECRKARL